MSCLRMLIIIYGSFDEGSSFVLMHFYILAQQQNYILGGKLKNKWTDLDYIIYK